jgi:hypothetical protein
VRTLWGAVTQVLPRQTFFLHTKTKAKTVLTNESAQKTPKRGCSRANNSSIVFWKFSFCVVVELAFLRCMGCARLKGTPEKYVSRRVNP